MCFTIQSSPKVTLIVPRPVMLEETVQVKTHLPVFAVINGESGSRQSVWTMKKIFSYLQKIYKKY